MKLFKYLTAVVLLVGANSAFARGGCEPCEPCAPTCNSGGLCDMDLCDMTYSAYVDYLYWQVNRGGLSFGDSSSSSSSSSSSCGQRFHCPDYDSGYRLGVVAHYKNWDFGVRYTSLCTDIKIGREDSCESSHHDKYSFDYRVCDIELGYSCCLCGDFTLRPFAGAKLAWIDEKLHFDGCYKFDNNSYGLYIGFEGRWNICNFSSCGYDIPVSLVTRGTTGVLRSSFKYGDYHCGKECLYTPYHDAFAGLDFTYSGCGSCDMNLQVGYEIQYWGARSAFEDCFYGAHHLGLGGLVVRLAANF